MAPCALSEASRPMARNTLLSGRWARATDAKSRKKAVANLGHVGKADPAAIPALIGALKDRDAAVRDTAVLALLNLGPDAFDGTDALAKIAQHDPDATVRAHATKALARIQP